MIGPAAAAGFPDFVHLLAVKALRSLDLVNERPLEERVLHVAAARDALNKIARAAEAAMAAEGTQEARLHAAGSAVERITGKTPQYKTAAQNALARMAAEKARREAFLEKPPTERKDESE